MPRKALALMLLALTFCPSSLPRASGNALDPNDVAAMMRALLSMVRIWNTLNSATGWESRSPWATAPPPSILPQLLPPPSAPWGCNGYLRLPPAAWARAHYPFHEPVPGFPRHRLATEAAARGSPNPPDLSGTWQGVSGDILVIHGNGFRIHNRDGLYSDGMLRIVDGHLVTYTPASGVTRRYELAQLGNRLALRDNEGQVLHFRR